MRVSKMILVVAVAALLALPAAAQPPFGRGGMRGGAGMLLGNPGVQKELKLSEEQTKKVQELVTKNGEKMREAFQGGDQEKTQEVMKEIAAETDKFIKATLNADQQKRLKQIQHQQMGPYAFANEEVAKELKLTDEQKEDIKKVTEELGAQSKEAFTGVDFQDQEARQAAFKKIQGLQKEATEKITKMLTPDQKKAWKDLTGDPFEVQLGPGGRGFGGGKGGKGKKQDKE
jgi:Spy/CpxP family protein refolding chaperone